ncbi:MAG: H-NS histone family protein [Phycisphaerales bacterium]|nr:H-NS histone family protein [Phycisphaerales bacterium]
MDRSARAPAAGTTAAAERQAHPNRGAKLPPKFLDPATGNKWSGRGLKPRWITDHEARGGSVEDFRVGR